MMDINLGVKTQTGSKIFQTVDLTQWKNNLFDTGSCKYGTTCCYAQFNVPLS